MAKFGLSKGERIKRREVISAVWEKGETIKSYPIRLLALPIQPVEGESRVQIMPVVAKKRFKRAVDRNAIKRLIREAYRLNKSELIHAVELNDLHLAVCFVYTGRDLPSFELIQHKIILSLQRLTLQIHPSSPESKSALTNE